MMIRLCSQICKKKIVSHASLKSIIHQAHVRKMATPYSSITSDGSWTLHYLATWAEVDHDRMAKGILYNYVSPSIQVTSLAGCGTVCVSTVFTLGPQVQVTLLSLMCYPVHRFVWSHIWCFLSVKQNAIDHATHYCRRWVDWSNRITAATWKWLPVNHVSSKTCPLNWNMPNRMRTWNPMERSWSTPYSFSIRHPRDHSCLKNTTKCFNLTVYMQLHGLLKSAWYNKDCSNQAVDNPSSGAQLLVSLKFPATGASCWKTCTRLTTPRCCEGVCRQLGIHQEGRRSSVPQVTVVLVRAIISCP